MSANLRGCVFSLCDYISGEVVLRAFQRFDFLTPSELLRYDPRKSGPTAQEIFTTFAKHVVDWKDREQAEDGLRALSAISEQAYSTWREDGYGDDVERWYGFQIVCEQLERACQKDGYQLHFGEISPDPNAHLDRVVELDLSAIDYATIVLDAQEQLNEAISTDPASEVVASKCKNLVEGICKHILGKRNALERVGKPGKPVTLEQLVKALHKELGIGEAGNSAPAMKDFAAGLDKLGLGVAQARNRTKVDHAQEVKNSLKPEEVELTLAVVVAWTRYVLQVYRKSELNRAPF
ncbi:hypothetical protein FRC0456_01001 [Corynebacterium diphtheriae]|uniref:abortive infection family protein n=1 Tax=Corynebacterium diphtheriae TaxID=1717 RepID=UPI0013CCF5F1|nr:abortive infection family protein [Corynebacterium diphtheriae]CAB0503958.1 hypothetical protein CIP101280_00959 [Corynebacterium diphtheriae]CAB0509256.1 hypothetical protein CIP101434_01248 [Corynebacterium diphtheriae]CAB0550206.1 hypothetical protein CIP107517_01074 [Corynebacterium diphtheriae]CAB0603748.1 hypothetical protein CIP107545_01252 [Corynebacterium diphtheriae]CAB0641914.1 hypothetical protein CIP107565_00888 [Corynebacterium diphtheriae]